MYLRRFSDQTLPQHKFINPAAMYIGFSHSQHFHGKADRRRRSHSAASLSNAAVEALAVAQTCLFSNAWALWIRAGTALRRLTRE